MRIEMDVGQITVIGVLNVGRNIVGQVKRNDTLTGCLQNRGIIFGDQSDTLHARCLCSLVSSAT